MDELFRVRLKSLRKEREKTQEDMSKILGVTRSTYTNYERGYITPPAATIEKIAKYFGVSIDYLLGKTNFTTHNEKIDANNDIADISKQINLMLDNLHNSNTAVTLDGELLDNVSREVLTSNLENSLKTVKAIMKKK